MGLWIVLLKLRSLFLSCAVGRVSGDQRDTEMAGRKLRKDRPKNRSQNQWVSKVTTDSTHPPPGLFTKSAPTIARTLASRKVSPKGPQSGMRMLNYFINRAGRGLSASRRAELERAKFLLSERIRRNASPSRKHKMLPARK